MTAFRTGVSGLCLLVLLNSAAFGGGFELVPINASGVHTIVGDQITLEGGGQRVWFEIYVSDWDPGQTGTRLRYWQATIDSTGYHSGMTGTLGAAVVPCTTAAECAAAMGSGFSLCNVPPFAGVECEAGFIEWFRPDYVFFSVADLYVVDLSTPDYRFASTVNGQPVLDPGIVQYAGTLVVDVPVGAMGTFTIGFLPADSAMADQDNTRLPLTILAPARVTIECQSSADCDDSDACTDDTCETDGTCSNITNYIAATHCCRPSDRLLTLLDNGNECTTGVCNVSDGSVTQQPLVDGALCGNAAGGECDAQDTCDGAGSCIDRFQSAGTDCGDLTVSECDNADTCDGFGACAANLEPAGAACGDATDVECNGADTCDGSGSCLTNIAAVDALCGSSADTECDDPDTCDGAGICLTNTEPSGLPCGDPVGDQCDGPDSCDDVGICQPNFVAALTPCGNPADTECDDPDTCDGIGGCEPNPAVDGIPCTDDGNECRDDVCSGGICSHPLSQAGTICGDPTSTDCDRADQCDGAGTCSTNLEPAGAACGDGTITDCDRADACDGAGTCLTNLEPVGAACGNPLKTQCDAPDSCDGVGSCLANVSPVGLPCGNQIGNQCDNPDTCDGVGACEPNFVVAATPCGNPGDTECDNADSCDGGGVCETNHELDGTLCTDDGNSCRDDTCVAGVCVHPLSPFGTFCGDPSDTDCDNPDICDGAGLCSPDLEPFGAACGDPSTTLCTAPDFCDGLGTCLPDNVADGTGCDDGSFCNAGATCLAGVCGGASAIDCGDGLACTDDSCNEGLQQCDHELLPGSCLINGVCYLTDDLNPSNSCEVCDPIGSSLSWSVLLAGTPCDDGDPCTGTGEPGIGIDECTVAGVCEGATDPNCNDDCINGVEVFEGVNIGNNDNRGPDLDEASCQFDSDNDVWFFYVASCTGPIVIDTIGSQFTPDNDTVLSVSIDCAGTEIACDDDSGPELLSLVAFQAVENETYNIRVAGYMDNSGDIVLNIATLDGCVIDGQCYANGQSNPDNGCEACMPLLSSMSWSARAAGAICGDPASGECDNPDACDGLGLCESNHKTDLTDCSDDGNDCTNDVCFSGACTHPFKSAGAFCGDATGTECDNPDTCDGAGFCLDNFSPTGLPCGDPATSECDNADVCDGNGSCDPNHQPDGLACPDDGFECTFDECATGACIHPSKAVGTVCGDAGDTGCDNPDTCDGVQTCLANFEPGGTTCGDPSDTECDDPDSCDGSGLCLSNFEPVGFTCGDPTDTGCDNPDSCDGDGTCRDNLEIIGFPCGDSSSTQCDDPDTCDGVGVCLTNFEPQGLPCGDSSTSECDNGDICDGQGACDPNHQPDDLACGDDGVECTFDLCDTGLCSHPPRLSGTACGSAADTGCDNPDTCDGSGACQFNYEPVAFACGDPLDTDCDNPDTCDGVGICLTNLEPVGLSCGDPTDTGCDNFDTCNGGGVCLDNYELDGFPCGDPISTQCDDPDTCDGGGACLPRFVTGGTACGNPADSECDNPDSCDGLGECGLNNEPEGLPCTDDGNDCRDDICVAGLCAHPPEPVDTPCGDPADTECDNFNTCNGGGACLDNFEPVGVACGDPSSDQCDRSDICDGGGACYVNHEPDGTACDDGDVCAGADACQDGDCVGVPVPAAPLVETHGPRHLAVSPMPAGSIAPVALKFTSPTWTCLSKYIDVDGLLVVDPVFQLPEDWDTIIVYGDDIIPGSEYVVEAECGVYVSPPGSATTCPPGDIVGPFVDGAWSPCDGSIDTKDLTAIVDAFGHLPSAPPESWSDVAPCLPDGTIDVKDITDVVNGFKHLTYPCPGPCP